MAVSSRARGGASRRAGFGPSYGPCGAADFCFGNSVWEIRFAWIAVGGAGAASELWGSLRQDPDGASTDSANVPVNQVRCPRARAREAGRRDAARLARAAVVDSFFVISAWAPQSSPIPFS